jgi:hypothetical protein
MPTSVRLDPETEALLAQLARSRGQTKSAVLRAALLRLAQDQPTAEAGDGPYALIADLVGIGPRRTGRPRAAPQSRLSGRRVERITW